MSIAGLTIQTLLPTALGPFDQWWDRIAASVHTGYNAIHFCPLQEMGNSRSPYSIRNHKRLEPTVFGEDAQMASENFRDLLARAKKPQSNGGLGLFFIS